MVKIPIRYGPYAENLRHVLQAIEGHQISGYADGGDVPGKQISLVPGALTDADAFLKGRRETSDRIARVAELVEGFETPYGLELLSSVHWVATQESAGNLEAVTTATYAWNERKRQFTRSQIALAWERLSEQGWMASRPLGRV